MNEKQQSVDERLRHADRVLHRQKGGRLFFRLLPFTFLFVVLVIVLDVVFHLSSSTRAWCDACLLAYVALAACVSCVVMFALRGTHERTARVLEQREPRLGSSLINHLLLRRHAGTYPRQSLTRNMADEAVRQYEQRLQDHDLPALARTGAVRRQARLALMWAGVLAITVLLGYKVTTIEFLRFADPYGDHPPFSFTRLEIIEPEGLETAVVYGEGLIVKAMAHGHRPRNVFVSFHPEGNPVAITTLPMYDKGEQGYSQKIDSIKTPLEVFVHTRGRQSISRRHKVSLILTPRLSDAFVRIEAPGYTLRPPTEKKMDFKTVRALNGSRLTFRLVSNRPLKSGWIESTDAEGATQRLLLAPDGPDSVAGDVTAEHSVRLRFGLVDVDGIASEEPWETALSVSYDLPPQIRMAFPGEDTFVCMNYKLPVRVQGEDDYGLARVRLNRGLNSVFTPAKGLPWEDPAPVRTVSLDEPLDLARLGLESGDIITLWAEAFDTAPATNAARSDAVRIAVISEEEYNAFLREQRDMQDMAQKYGALMDKLQARMDEQVDVRNRLKELTERLAEAETDEERKAIEQEMLSLLARQQEINRNLDKLADEMSDFVRDQPVYDIESDLAEELQNLAKRIRASTGANAGALAELRGAGAGAPGTPPPLGEDLERMLTAAEQQLRELGLVEKEGREDVQEVFEDLALLHELMKDFNEFEKLYAAQERLTQQLETYRERNTLSREDELVLKDVAENQRRIGQVLHLLEDKLRRDADAARDLFPRAATSGQDLADAVNKMRMTEQSDRAAGRILACDTKRGYALAEALRADMEKLFSDCQGGQGEASQALDGYLKLSRNLPSRRNFEQMRMCRKMAFGAQLGRGLGAAGNGPAGTSGYSISTGDSMAVLGGESSIGNPASQTAMYGDGAGPGQDAADARLVLELDKTEVLTGYDEVTRESEAVVGEAEIAPYREIVDSYFRKITGGTL